MRRGGLTRFNEQPLLPRQARLHQAQGPAGPLGGCAALDLGGHDGEVLSEVGVSPGGEERPAENR